jgi:hypothetical protein
MKIGNLYDLKAFTRFMDSARRPGFADAYAGAVLARNLTAVDPKIFEKKYPELSFVTSGIVADNSGGYARRIQSLRKREQGGFKTSGDTSSEKGKISLAAEDSTLLVAERSAESDWTDSEIKESELQGLNLVSDYITAHNKTYLREIDEIGYIGIADKAGTTGLLNYAGFTSGAAGGTIETRTAQEMYDEFATLITDQANAVNNTPEYKANRVDMPTAVLNLLAVTILNTAAGPASVLSALKANFPGVEFRSTFRAESVGGTSKVVAYSNSDEVMKMRIPLPLQIGEIIKLGSFDYHVDSKYRIAGLDVLENLGGRVLTGL